MHYIVCTGKLCYTLLIAQENTFQCKLISHSVSIWYPFLIPYYYLTIFASLLSLIDDLWCRDFPNAFGDS